MLNKSKLKLAIRRTGLNIYDFADKAGIKRTSLYVALNNAKGLHFDTVEKIAKVLDEYDVVKRKDFFDKLTDEEKKEGDDH